MTNYKISVIVGSIRKDSLNKKLANAIIKLASPSFSFNILQINNLPLYNQDEDDNQSEVVKHFKKDIESSSGVLFVTPEYNRSIPGVLKNAIDHGSRPYGQNSWAGKPTGIIGSSVGTIGTALAQQHLRNILGYLDMPILGQPEAFIHVKDGFFDDAGNIGSSSKEFLQNWMNKFTSLVEKHSV